MRPVAVIVCTALVAIANGAGAQCQGDRTIEPSSLSGEQRVLAEIALETFRALLPGSTAQVAWAQGASGRTIGRAEAPDPYDIAQSPEVVHADQQAFHERRRWDPLWSPDSAELLCAVSTVDRDRATVRARFLVLATNAEENLDFGAVMELRRNGARWLVHSVRDWQEAYAFYDEQERYDAAHWRRMDRRIGHGRPTTTAAMRRRFGELQAARHTADAFDLALVLCARPDALPDDCFDAVELGYRLGRGSDTAEPRARGAERALAAARWFERPACARGTRLDREATPEGTLVSCRRRDGEREGLATLLDASGAPRETGRFTDGSTYWYVFDERGRFVRRQLR